MRAWRLAVDQLQIPGMDGELRRDIVRGMKVSAKRRTRSVAKTKTAVLLSRWPCPAHLHEALQEWRRCTTVLGWLRGVVARLNVVGGQRGCEPSSFEPRIRLPNLCSGWSWHPWRLCYQREKRLDRVWQLTIPVCALFIRAACAHLLHFSPCSESSLECQRRSRTAITAIHDQVRLSVLFSTFASSLLPNAHQTSKSGM